MRSIARQSVRLARSSSRAKDGSYIRQFRAQNIRKFHGSSRISLEPRGSSEQHNDHHNPLDAHKEEHNARTENIAAVERDEDNNDSQHVADTPGARRTWRQRRVASDIPKPPPIPGWFLEHNVKLLSSSTKPDYSGEHAQNVACTDETSGHNLLVFPNYEAYADNLDTEFRRPTDDAAVTTSVSADKWADKSEDSAGCDGARQHGDLDKTTEPPNFVPRRSQRAYNRPGYDTLLRWTLLEIESGVRAAFTLPGRAQPASSYAASSLDMSLLCPHTESHVQLDQFMEDLANLTDADLIRLDANDFADLTSEYVGHGLDSPGWFSTLAYEVYDGFTSIDSGFGRPTEEESDDGIVDDVSNSDSPKGPGINLGNPMSLEELQKALYENRHEFAKALGGIPIQGIAVSPLPGDASAKSTHSQLTSRSATSSSLASGDEARLRALLESLLEAPRLKRAQGAKKDEPELPPRIKSLKQSVSDDVDWLHRSKASGVDKAQIHHVYRTRRSQQGYWFPDVAGLLIGQLEYLGISTPERARWVRFSKVPHTDSGEGPGRKRRTLVHVRDLLDICQSPVGTAIARRLLRVVQNRRKAGEEICLIGTSCQEAQGPLTNGQQEHDSLPIRHLVLPPFFAMPPDWSHSLRLPAPVSSPAEEGHHRVIEINLRHIQSMLRRLRPTEELPSFFMKSSQALINLPGTHVLSEQVLPFEHVHRIVLTAIGLSQVHALSTHITALHIGLAALITSQADEVVNLWSHASAQTAAGNKSDESTAKPRGGSSKGDRARARMDELKKICNSHESRLLSGVVDPENITTSFKEVHAPAETIEALKTLTSLSLIRPDAFKYGVLAKDRLPGLMLYGPPGTGKTMLAKAVAKESQATVLEISGAQIYEKYVGEGEKMVRAVFSLAKKLSPCIVFIDEADSIFGARKSGGNRNTHREIINQFLREWDGMDAHNIFLMVASNRPFDLDDAVLRRVPRRLLVDLPVTKDRESILGIHLKDEQLDESVSLTALAEKTPLYSGSDLKNFCVAAALACVREENDQLNYNKNNEDFKLPEKRTLASRHFDQAVREISASISEDMDSLTAIRKFDEQYGDRRGRRKKTEYGFGLGSQDGVDEYAARVRQTTQPMPDR